MRCRHFTLRLTAQHAQDDETRINDFMQSVQIHSVQTAAGTPGHWSVLIFYDEATIANGSIDVASQGQPRAQQTQASTAAAPIALAEDDGLTPEQLHIYERLREWRSQRAATEGKPAYVIAHNAVLKEIARRHMDISAADDLLAISQFGPARAARYGPGIIDLLAALTAEATPLLDGEC
jgi:superfamily II DNA helicase RecQ